MTNEEIAATGKGLLILSGAIGAGIGLLLNGLMRNLDVSLGVGILSAIGAFLFFAWHVKTEN